MEKNSEIFMKLIFIATFMFSLVGCSTWHKLNGTEKGAVIGTGSGAALGGAVGGTGGALLGGVGGGVVGGVIGHEQDDDDKRKKH
jgi:hypothetical protein